MDYWKETLKSLESDLEQGNQNRFFADAKTRHPSLSAFTDVNDMIKRLRTRTLGYALQDAVILGLILEYQRFGSSPAMSILYRVFWPMLCRNYWRRVKAFAALETMTGKTDDLWGRIVYAFSNVIASYPTESDRSKVAVKIKFDVWTWMRKEDRAEPRLRKAEAKLLRHVAPTGRVVRSPRDEDSEQTPYGRDDQDSRPHQCPMIWSFVASATESAAPPDEEEYAAAHELLDGYRAAGVIDSIDHGIFFEHLVREKPLGQVGIELGLSREATKKRYRRALERMRQVAPPTGSLNPCPHGEPIGPSGS